MTWFNQLLPNGGNSGGAPQLTGPGAPPPQSSQRGAPLASTQPTQRAPAQAQQPQQQQPPTTFAQMQAAGQARPPMPAPTQASTDVTPYGQPVSISSEAAAPLPSASGTGSGPQSYVSGTAQGTAPGLLGYNTQGLPSGITNLGNGQWAPTSNQGPNSGVGGMVLPSPQGVTLDANGYPIVTSTGQAWNPADEYRAYVGAMNSNQPFTSYTASANATTGQQYSPSGSASQDTTGPGIAVNPSGGGIASQVGGAATGAQSGGAGLPAGSMPVPMSPGYYNTPSGAIVDAQGNVINPAPGGGSSTPATSTGTGTNTNQVLNALTNGSSGGGAGGQVGSATNNAVLNLLQNPDPYNSDEVKNLYNWEAGNIQDQYALQKQQLGDEMARRGLGTSTINAGNLNNLNIGQRSAQESLAENLNQNLAQSLGQYEMGAAGLGNTVANSADANQRAWLGQLMGFGEQGFQNDLATQAMNQNQQQAYQQWLEYLMQYGNQA